MDSRKKKTKKTTHVALPSEKDGGPLENNYISFYSLSPNYPPERPRTMAPQDGTLRRLCVDAAVYTRMFS